MSKTTRWLVGGGAVLIGIVLAVVAVLLINTPTPEGVTSKVVPLSRAVTPQFAPAPTSTPEQQEQPAEPTPEPENTVSISSLGFSAPLSALVSDGVEINPPDFEHAWVVADYSVPLENPETGAILVVFHSLRNGSGLGNHLFDQATGTSKVKAGDVVVVRGITYEVTHTQAVAKKDIPTTDEVWANKPGLLVLVTCLQKPDRTASTSNFIVFAKKIAGGTHSFAVSADI